MEFYFLIETFALDVLLCYSNALEHVFVYFTQGYLKVTAIVLGPGDEIPVSRLFSTLHII